MRSSRRLQFTPEARADLRDILQYTLEAWGPRQRDAYASALDQAFSRLIEFPNLGIARPDLFPGCHTRRVGEHIIYYRVRERSIRVIRVLHGRQDAAAEFASGTPAP